MSRCVTPFGLGCWEFGKKATRFYFLERGVYMDLGWMNPFGWFGSIDINRWLQLNGYIQVGLCFAHRAQGMLWRSPWTGLRRLYAPRGIDAWIGFDAERALESGC